MGNITTIIAFTNNYANALTLTDSENKNTSGNIDNLGSGDSQSTSQMSVPWYYAPTNDNFQNHNILITGGPTATPNIRIWQNGNNVYWSYNVPSGDDPYTAGTVLCAVGGNIFLAVDDTFTPSAEAANGQTTILLSLQNQYIANISLTDSEGKGTNATDLAPGDNFDLTSMNIPWYYSPTNKIFSNHNITISGGQTKGQENIYLWQNQDVIYWSYNEPGGDDPYTDGTILFPAGTTSGEGIVLTVSAAFTPQMFMVDMGAATFTAQTFLKDYQTELQTLYSNIQSFLAKEGDVFTNAINDLGSLITEPSLATILTTVQNVQTGFSNFVSLAALLPGALGPFTPKIASFGACFEASFFVGGAFSAGVAYDITEGEGCGYLSEAAIVSGGIGIEVGQELALSSGDLSGMAGTGINVTLGASWGEGVAVTISFGVPTNWGEAFEVQGISLTPMEGIEAGITNLSFSTTQISDTFSVTPASKAASS